MKAIAKRDIKYIWYDYINFITNNKYDVVFYGVDYITKIKDEKGEWVEYCGELKHLEELFEFVEE